MRLVTKSIALLSLLAAVMVIPATAFGDIGLPVIRETVVVYDSAHTIMQKINVLGQNFGTAVGTVTLGRTPLTVVAWGDQEVVASLPANTGPGSYLLVVTRPTRPLPLMATLAVTLGAQGPQGVGGPAGAAGPREPRRDVVDYGDKVTVSSPVRAGTSLPTLRCQRRW